MALDITHIGEALVAELLKENETVQKNFKRLYDADINVTKAMPNADIENGDPKHQIDILLIGEKNAIAFAIAIEAKLGASLKSPSSFYKAHLAKEFDFKNKKGSMIQFFSNCINEIKLKDRESIALAEKWVLLVRTNKIKDNLNKNNFIDKEKIERWGKMLNSCTIISLVDLLKGIDKADFNEAVKKCISSNDYCESWGIKLSGVSGLSSEE